GTIRWPRPTPSVSHSRISSPRRSRRTHSTRTAPGGCRRRTAVAPPPWSAQRSGTPQSGGSEPSVAPQDASSDQSLCRLIDEWLDRFVASIPGIHDVDDPAQVVERGELHGDLALALPEVDLDPRLQAIGEAL